MPFRPLLNLIRLVVIGFLLTIPVSTVAANPTPGLGIFTFHSTAAPSSGLPESTPGEPSEQYGALRLSGVVVGGVILLLGGCFLLLNLSSGWRRRRVSRKSEELSRLLEALGDGVFGLDQQSHCNFINPAALQMLGYREDEVLGSDAHALFHRKKQDGSEHAKHDCPVIKTLHDGENRHMEDWFVRKNGTGLPVQMTVTPVFNQTRPDGVVVVFRDISQRLRLEHELRTQATTDALTGLLNRRQFLKELDGELNRVQHQPAQPSAILMVDLDNFKSVNDRYGHSTGDIVLRHFANELVRLSRKSDKLGRLGGEEFCILLPGDRIEQACQMAERLCRRIAGSVVHVGEVELRYTVSIGVAMMRSEDPSVDAALARADAALYRAKHAGRNGICCEFEAEGA